MTEYYAPLGNQGTANSTTSQVQTRPQAAALVAGGYVVVWQDSSGSPDDPSLAIRGQLFDSTGARTGEEFLVNTATAGDQIFPSVVALSGGGFLVTWTASASTGGGIAGQLYTAQGVKSGGEFLVNAGGEGEARASASLGGFAVVWVDHSASGTAIRGQFFATANTGSGVEILVSPEVSDARSDLAIAQAGDGSSNNARLVVTWTQANGDGSGTAVMAQIIDYFGERYGPAFPVSQSVEGDQRDAAVASYGNADMDRFVVAYVDCADSDGTGAITVRTFDGMGHPISADLRLTQPGSGAHDPSVILFGSGLFAVSWSDADGRLVVQIVNASGEILGEPLEISSEGELASLIRLGEESFVATWTDGDIQARIFAPTGPAVADVVLSDTQVGEAIPANLAVAELGATGIGGSSGFTYTLLADSSGGAFTLEGNRLVLADPSLIDFETAPQVQLTVRATDSGGRMRDEVFTLDVADSAVEPQGWTASDPFPVKDMPFGAAQASVAPLASGGFVMVYNRHNTGDGPVRGQIFSDSGEKVGPEFHLASASNGQPPLVVGLADGGFAILYPAVGANSGSPPRLFTQLFDSQGLAVGDPVRVGTGADGQTGTIAALPGGGFVVSYSNAWYAAPSGEPNLFVQMFDKDGDASGVASAVATGYEARSIAQSDVAPLADGGFVVTWQNATGYTVHAQRFDEAGIRVGSTFRVDSGATYFAIDASVTGLAGGGFVITWSEGDRYEFGQTDPWSVKAQIFDSAGARVGEEFIVHSDSVAEQRISTVTPLAHGGFMVVWNEHVDRPDIGDSDWAGGITRAQMFDSAGNRIGGEFALGEGFTQPQYYVSAATLSWGGVVVSYTDLTHFSTGAQTVLLSPGTFDARDDSIVAFESSGAAGTLFGDNGAGSDSAPADGTLVIAEVNGSAGNVGETLTLASGARLTVNADGTFDYDPNHAFDSLADFSTGGSNAQGADSFSYRLAGGDTANVTLVIRGEYSSPHVVQGSAGDDMLTGTNGADTFMLQLGGQDRVQAGAGNDAIFFIGSLTGADVVDGGAGNDTLILQGAYAGGLTLSANVTNIELISILAGSNTNFGEPGTNRHDYVLTVNDANFSGGIQVRVNGSALLAGEDFTFDGSAELDSRFVVYGGRGKDTLTGSRNNDIFFLAEDRFATGDTVNGGAGYDGMFLRGNYTIDFNAPGYTGLFTNIENLTLTSATDERYARGGGTEFDYNITLSNAVVNPGETLTVSGALLMASETMIVDASAEADGSLSLFGGKASDTLKGGALADLIHGNLGADQLTGNGGADTFRYQGVGESTASSLDHILDFAAGTDKVDLSRMDADTNVAGNQAFSWIGSSAFSGTAGQLRAYQDGSSWFVEGDTNGDSIADLVIQLTVNGGPLTQSDFLP